MNRRFTLEANHPKLPSTFSTRYQVLTAMTIYVIVKDLGGMLYQE